MDITLTMSCQQMVYPYFWLVSHKNMVVNLSSHAKFSELSCFLKLVKTSFFFCVLIVTECNFINQVPIMIEKLH